MRHRVEDQRTATPAKAPDQPARRPHVLWLATEGPRALGELAWLQAAKPLMGRVKRGDGHHVLVLPGLGASDRSTQAMRNYLRDLGYHVHGWRLGQNIPGPDTAERLADRLQRVHVQQSEPVSLVGWSLGGLYARSIARMVPDDVRQVITLGSPFRTAPGEESHPEALVRALLRRQGVEMDETGGGLIDDSPVPVPSTSIFSRSDGVVPWRACLDTQGGPHETLEVVGSHCGLGHHPAALWAMATRLALPVDPWAPLRIPVAWRSVLRRHRGA